MKILALFASAFLAVTASLTAHAQPSGRDHPRRFERPQQERNVQKQREFQRQREFRRDEEVQRRKEEGGERPGRLTPEERQQLRRDIREHGRDVYRDRPRRRF